MGGISTWRDAAEFLLLGAASLQVCTAVMHYGFRIIEDLCDGLSNWMDAKGFATIADVPRQKPEPDFGFPGSRSFLPRRGAHRRGALHQMQSLLRGLQRCRASVHRSHGCGSVVRSTTRQWREPLPRPAACTRAGLRRVPVMLQRVSGGALHQMVELASGGAPVTWEQLAKGPRGSHRRLGCDGRNIAPKMESKSTDVRSHSCLC